MNTKRLCALKKKKVISVKHIRNAMKFKIFISEYFIYLTNVKNFNFKYIVHKFLLFNSLNSETII